ncbi:hypothetical protein ACIRBZ_10540 [Streptomyces sp. NPDC094038]|uniref:hypothetical protein n=1 Tax=Streptomyces sp. NPDC094038 TaxID=3366055 RepID=UPI003810C2A8
MTMYRAHRASTSPTTLRLLPWHSPDGKPCYLSTDDNGGYLSRLADDMEAMQLSTAEDILSLTRAVLEDPASPPTEVRYAGLRLAECLTDALRVAESRRRRLPTPRTTDPDDGDPVQEQPVRTPGSGLWS